jgi:small conductance mechanosensitive channel
MNESAAQLQQQASQFQQNLVAFLKAYGGRILAALVILAVAFMVGRWLGKVLDRALERRHLDPPLRMLITRIVRLIVLAFALVLAAQNLGVEVMPLVAGIGVVGVGVGLAAQGVLGNVIAGLTIIFTHPFRVGEYVEVLGEEGQVERIELFTTTLMHLDRSKVVIPNRKIVGEILHNYGAMRQLDLTVSVAYDTNLPEVLTLLRGVLGRHPRVLKDPAPFLGVRELGDSAIDVAVRPWVAVEEYQVAQDELYQAMVECLRSARVEMPFPQQEIRILGDARGT